MNIELEEVILQDVSDEALESIAGSVQGDLVSYNGGQRTGCNCTSSDCH